jgi:hypothetical protein
LAPLPSGGSNDENSLQNSMQADLPSNPALKDIISIKGFKVFAE